MLLVPRAGIEPARLAARDFESRASTYSAISATHKRDYDINRQNLQYARPIRLVLICKNKSHHRELNRARLISILINKMLVKAVFCPAL